MARIHLTSIAADPNVGQRLTELAREFEYQFLSCVSVDEFAEKIGEDQAVMVVFSAVSIKVTNDIAGHIQVIKQVAPEAFVVVIAERKISPETVAFLKKSGASLILLENTFFETSQMEYLGSQIIRGSLVPIKASELRPNTDIDFQVLVMMPLNQKILPVATRGSTLSENKIKKLREAKELFIARDDLPKFQAYAEKHKDLSADGVNARCRLQYLNLCRAHTNLVFLLIDQGEAASFTQGKQLLSDCDVLAKDLLSNLASVEDPWSVINNSSLGESGSAERSTSIAAMAGLLALAIDKVTPDAAVLAGLLSDFGLLDLHPNILRKIRNQGLASLNAEEMALYQQHPVGSVNRCLSRKLPLPENVKSIVMCTHEQANAKGFPKQIVGDKIPLESQIIAFCQIIDEQSIVKMGETKKLVRDIQKTTIQSEMENKQKFDLKFLMQLKSNLGI